jgi:membrane protein
MASLKERLTATVERLRARYGWFDHTLKMVAHYGYVNGNAQAGAVTYFGFLSVFPILAIAFFVVGIVARVYPDIRPQMVDAISQLLPGVIGPDGIDVDTIGNFSGWAGLIGLVGVLYAGLGWLSALRQALEVVFVVPRAEKAGFLVGKSRDLLTLVLIGIVLMVSVVVSGAVTGFSGDVLDLVGIDPGATLPTIGLSVIGHLLGIAASTVLLLTMFKLLVVESHVPRGAMVAGSLLGAVGFEILKAGANLLLGFTKGNPAFQAFGIALILLVWINYFSRLVVYSAAWAYTSPGALALRTADAMRAPGAALSADAPAPAPAPTSAAPASAEARGPASSTPLRRPPWLLAGLAAAAGGLVAVVVRAVRR